jgi:ATP-dependent helicase/nuclease subunit A
MSDFQQNMLVVAGAGTGKTALLIGRILHWLLGEFPRRHEGEEADLAVGAVHSLAAITFTEKAASEMSERLMQALLLIQAGGEPPGWLRLVRDSLRSTFGLSEELLRERAGRLLAVSDRAEIHTIHAFCSRILRRFPAAAEVAPEFVVDADKRLRRELFERRWHTLIRDHLGAAQAGSLDDWRVIHAAINGRLETLEEFLWSISLRAQLPALQDEAALRNWLGDPDEMIVRLADLMTGLDPDLSRLVNDRRLKRFQQDHEEIVQPVQRALAAPDPLAALSRLRASPGLTRIGAHGAAEERVRELMRAKTVTRLLGEERCAGFAEELRAAYRLAVRLSRYVDNARFWRALTRLFRPFLEELHAEWTRKGLLGFDDLLRRVERLLRRRRDVRARLKARYGQVLVDESQDTDPIQSVIVAFLCERADSHAGDPSQVKLEPGKLFVVGDPKQSIYGFRGADLAAFDWLAGLVDPDGAGRLTLSTNFRSTVTIVGAVNTMFADRFQPREELQPGYAPLVPRPEADAGPAVELWLASTEDSQTAAPAPGGSGRQVQREIQAHAIAETISARVRGKAAGPGERYRDFAILLRAMTQVQPFMEALERLEIPFVVEGDKEYYRRQEVRDLINLLTAVFHPLDTAAFIGLLRSPLVGVPESGLVRLAHLGLLTDWGRIAAPDQSELRSKLEKETWTPAYLHAVRSLLRMRDAAGRLPIQQWIAELQRLIYSARYLGDRRAANVIKLLRDLEELLPRPGGRFLSWLREQRIRQAEAREEAEGVLADENLDAVRILTIHKAKGLEFPVVFCADLSLKTGRQSHPEILSRWTPRGIRTEIALGEFESGGYQELLEWRKQREACESVRLAYVAFTRAEEQLILTSGPTREKLEPPEGKSLVTHVLSALPDLVHLLAGSEPPEQHSWIRVRALAPPPGSPPRAPERPFHWPPVMADYAAVAQRRERRYQRLMSSPPLISPSLLQDREREEAPPSPGPEEGAPAPVAPARDHALLLGLLCHRIMELLDFSDPERSLAELISGNSLAQLEGLADSESAPELIEEAGTIIRGFLGSPAFNELRRAEILARELPFLLPLAALPLLPPEMGDTPRASCHGVIDLVCRLDQRIVVIDYKTDRVADSEQARARAEHYRLQQRFYCEAVRGALGLEQLPEFRLVFLRTGDIVPVE